MIFWDKNNTSWFYAGFGLQKVGKEGETVKVGLPPISYVPMPGWYPLLILPGARPIMAESSNKVINTSDGP